MNASGSFSQASDFELKAGSPAIGAGLNLSAYFTTDYAGNARPATGAWDAGAYQNTLSTPTPAPTPTPTPSPEQGISFVQQNGASTTSTLSTEQCAFNSDVSPGDQVIVYMDWGNGATISRVTDQFGNTYKLAASTATSTVAVAVYYATIPSGESPMITVSFGSPAVKPEIEIYEFSGISGI